MTVDIEEKNEELTKRWFTARVEALVKSDKIPYMDAVLELCEHYDIEPALAGSSLISESIEQHIKQEALSLNMYRESSDALPGV